MPTSTTPPPQPSPGVPAEGLDVDVDAAALPAPLPEEDLVEDGKVSAGTEAASGDLDDDADEKKPAAKKKGGRKKKVPSSAEQADDGTNSNPSSGGGTLKRVAKTSLAFRTDIESESDRRTHPSGIIHAAKASRATGREEHAFGWVQDAAIAEGVRGTVEWLGGRGFRPFAMRFIPFSSKENWERRYPGAFVSVECDAEGNVVGNPRLEEAEEAAAAEKKKELEAAVEAAKAKAANGARRGRKPPPPPKLLAHGRLPDAERDELHKEIHEYFTWLHDELVVMETHNNGRRRVQSAGISVPALKGLLGKIELSFRVIREGGKGGKANDEDGGTADVDKAPLDRLPFLEKKLELELNRRLPGQSSASTPDKSSPQKPRAKVDEGPSYTSLPFDTLFEKLVAFNEEKGHASPPVRNKELGRWVQELRANKKSLEERGLECEPDLSEAGTGDAAAAAGEAGEGTPPPTPKGKKRKRGDGGGLGGPLCRTNSYLTRSRIERLDSIGFPWTLLPNRVSWDDRFEELKRFKEENGRFPTNKEGTIGNWLKQQRRLYTKNDANFMAHKSHRFEEIGCPLRPRKYSTVTWEDRFQQLVEFGRVNGHFNVPNPFPNSEYNQHDKSSELFDRKRFRRFVEKLHTEYRNLQKGVPSTMLTEERIAQLRDIGFEFSLKPERVVPDLDWSTRIQQLESFQSEMGHMRVDFNYEKYSNLGGWAVEISERHRAWREGRQYLPPDVIEQFEQLSSLGFGFDVFRPKRNERSWEESFDLLLQYREETGSCRVPHHYKADSRLGSWVSVQRTEYKLLMQGKPSRMTQERIQQLENVGFEWVARRGRDD